MYLIRELDNLGLQLQIPRKEIKIVPAQRYFKIIIYRWHISAVDRGMIISVAY